MSKVLAEYRSESGQVIQARQGDLTLEDTDAIVNAANSQLAHGGGVAGAIVRHGGQAIQEESDRWVRQHGPVPTGQVAVTGGGALPARYVIHAVGPVWQGGSAGEEELLEQAAWNSLIRAHELALSSIAMPAISSGIFGFPKPRCVQILVRTALKFCRQYPDSPVRQIRLVNIDAETAELVERELRNQETGSLPDS